MPTEEAYIDFLAQKNIPMQEMEMTMDLDNLIPFVKKEIRKDRKVLELCEKACVSYLRGYKEHHCNYIFSFKHLPLLEILNSFGMMKIPKLPDLPMAHLELEFVSENTDNIPYKDRIKERHRIKKIKKMTKIKTPKQLKAERARAKWGKEAKEERRKLQIARDREEARVTKEIKLRQQKILEERGIVGEGEFGEIAELEDYGLIQNLKKRKLGQESETGTSFEDNGESPQKKKKIF
jgi:ATP-dependent RNA helicase DDX55/SPB4